MVGFSMESLWAAVVGFEGQYRVSRDGRVLRSARELVRSNGVRYTVAEQELAQVRMGRDGGYRGVALKSNGKNRVHLVHRLVAEAFLPNPELLPAVNHKNMEKADNTVDNLEWVTARANQHHAAKRGRFHGLTNPKARVKLTPECVADIKARLAAGIYQYEIAAEFGVSQSLISMIRNGHAWADPKQVFRHVA